MKVLFSALHFGYFRNFESVIHALVERGHHVHLAADEPDIAGGQGLVERLAATHRSVTFGWTPGIEREPWCAAAQKLRYALDYVRFLDARYADAPKLRLRSIERTPRIVRWLTTPLAGISPGRRPVEAGLKWAERMMPRSAAMERWLEDEAPDVLLLASLTYPRSTNIEQLKIARSFGVPVAACIMSWDHLSSKALLHIAPDATIVWNDVQRREAIDLHGLPADSVAVTGAQCYDQWFSRRPDRSREEFCRAVGLPADRPFVLYVCSAMSPSPEPPEPAFVKRWVEAVRSCPDPVLRNAGLLIRPHPERLKEWRGIELHGLEHVVIAGRNPIDDDAKADYFDALFYSAAVAGVCTSAFIEAAIIGRPILTPLLPEFAIHQNGMAHFRYLRDVEGGVLRMASSLDEHLSQLATALAEPPGRDERNRRFLTAFVRPAGLDRPATPLFVDEVERLALSDPRAPETARESSPAARTFVERLAVSATTGVGRWLLMDAIDDARARSERQSDERRRAIEQQRADYRAAKRRKRDAMVQATEDERRAKHRRKWRRGLNPRKQVARLKGGVKQLIGARHQ
ncbi:MAG: hypothetical protein FJW14_02665 [Acidimicrobiia bacterium]|nr:hypothetical protein [Acidimicrobiia bacterium]